MFKINYYSFLLSKTCPRFLLVKPVNTFTNYNHLKLSSSTIPGFTFKKKQHDKETIDNNYNNAGSWGHRVTPVPKETEEQHLVRVRNDPDTFGEQYEQEIVDEGDIREEKHLSEKPPSHQRLRTKQYADIIKNYIRKRKIKEAIDVLEIRMIQEDKIKPEAYIYNLVLGACGRVGYTKKAFMLYNDMKKRGLKVMGGTYTALFNACANSPWPTTDGLTRAKHLYELMLEKGYQPNDTNYNAMIKAFGRCGDISMSFKLVDQMFKQGISVKSETINFLLQACISDKEAGFRHSLLVWRKLIEKNINPDLYTFNLLLRCVRDCGLGDLEVTKDVIERIVQNNGGALFLESSEALQIDITSEQSDITSRANITSSKNGSISENDGTSGQNDITSGKNDNIPGELQFLNTRPDLLAPKPHLGNILSLSEVKASEDRLLLLGGCKGFLQTMTSFKCTPDIKTFTQLLDSIPSTNAAEKELVQCMRKLSVKPDIDFYNMLIKKKSMRCDYEGAKEVLLSMKNQKYRPDLVTYGVLALGCKNKDEALDLIREMNSYSYTLNSVILGAMLHQACYHETYDYIFEIMEICLRQSIPVSKKFLERLDEFRKRCKTKLDSEKMKPREMELFKIFKMRHKTWLTEVQIDESEDAHPWQQFRQGLPEDAHETTGVKDTARFKPRHASRFKVKTSTKEDFKKAKKAIRK
ncbi:pentatricopeptide repeat-containing protein 1, mitochondrial [Sitophilus oryzae]|uniref:Pentatricopeptide repeat-containing protein 1, mitochondrial n=1 Tax=Sitophilus oryzae TaxID=7048 RepID=A0A6J2XRA6_SITOR|nr:pentatricopeptide repeat-containing protein 1, mitochondrial [Sitophilus oryzae]